MNFGGNLETELLAQLCATMERIEGLLAAQQQPLGFGGSPRPRFVFCNRSQKCLWYYLDDAGEAVPIEQTALTCVLERLEFNQVMRRQKDVWKMHLHVRADRSYVLEAGFDSNFAKSIISALAIMQPAQLRAPVTIEVQAADAEEVLFGRIYSGGEAIFAGYSDQTDWKTAAKRAIASVNGAESKPHHG